MRRWCRVICCVGRRGRREQRSIVMGNLRLFPHQWWRASSVTTRHVRRRPLWGRRPRVWEIMPPTGRIHGARLSSAGDGFRWLCLLRVLQMPAGNRLGHGLLPPTVPDDGPAMLDELLIGVWLAIQADAALLHGSIEHRLRSADGRELQKPRLRSASVRELQKTSEWQRSCLSQTTTMILV